ncbi:MAG: hypothetical protein ACHQT6_05270 [Candidatus Acidiferrales bacterium]
MGHGFDGFEIDDFRGSDYDSERGMGGGSGSSWDKWRELQEIYREEERTDALSREAQQRSGKERPPLPREERVREILEQRTRTAYADRKRTYSLRDSEIYTLSEVGKFRVVAKKDLAEFSYNHDRSRMENDVENLYVTLGSDIGKGGPANLGMERRIMARCRYQNSCLFVRGK